MMSSDDRETDRQPEASRGRNANLQGQGSPIRDDMAPPEQGWRGERTADPDADKPGQEREVRTQDGSVLTISELSGIAAAETHGLGDANRDERSSPCADGPRRATDKPDDFTE
ncbi:hypothetical protein [Sphingomonas crocodyli]|uniref:Uncharacterized protein n=1 Tax=Sphingomonas crocodyli TaxID=1979270 RepID=A0A437LYA4_9SPHN|nr:hypothetical protein [Sphingomonas crocodyli]RVT90345.1 hypothetical protein EOD43_18945 [Sphingomonas crocodyli]